jgi:hypothetical protein
MARSQPGEMQARRSRRYLLSSRAASMPCVSSLVAGSQWERRPSAREQLRSAAVRRRRVRGLARRPLQRLSKSMEEGGCASQVGGCELTLKVEVEAARLAVELSSCRRKTRGTAARANWRAGLFMLSSRADTEERVQENRRPAASSRPPLSEP